MTEFHNMETFYSYIDTAGASANQAYIIDSRNMQEPAYSVMQYASDIPYENEEISNFQPNSMQLPRRAQAVMSSGNNFYGEVRKTLSDSSTWFSDQLPLVPDFVRLMNPVGSLQNTFVHDSPPQYSQEVTVVAIENIHKIDVDANCEVTDVNEQEFAANEVVGLDESFQALFNDDLLNELLVGLTNPSYPTDSTSLPVVEEGLPTPLPHSSGGLNSNCLIDYLTQYDPSPGVPVEASAQKLQIQAQERQLQIQALEPQQQNVAPGSQTGAPRKRGRPRKDTTNQNTSLQKNVGAIPFDAYGQPGRKAKLICQDKIRASMSREDTTGSSSDQEYTPGASEVSARKKIRRVSSALQDDFCSSTSGMLATCGHEKRKKNNDASKKSRDKKKNYFKSIEKTCEELEMKNARLLLKAAKMQKAVEYILNFLRPKSE